MIPALLCLFALLDGTLLGFRAAAGRNGLIDKRRYFRRAMAIGVLASAAAALALIGFAALLVWRADDPVALWAALVDAGARSLRWWIPYGLIAMVAILAWSLSTEARTVATVVILGPFTLARPLVVIAGLVAGALPAGRFEVQLFAATVGAVTLSLEPLLTRRYPIDPALLGD